MTTNNRLEMNFTKTNIDSIPLPAKRITYHDTHKMAAGLQLRVSPTGIKSFCIVRRIKDVSTERITLGRFPQMTIDQARKQAGLINAAILEGSNPAAIKRAHKAEKVFSELFTEYMDRHAKPKKLSWKDDAQRYEHYLHKQLGNKKLSSINRRAVAEIHSKITLDGHPTVANRVLALVSGVYGWGINAGIVDTNPAIGIRRNKEISRDRFLQNDELPRFFAALDEEPNDTMKDYFLVSLFTGARRANVLSMRWNDISFERAEWRLEVTKNGDPQTVTLSPEVIEILKSRLPSEENVFVFPSNGKNGHLAEPKSAWKRILKRANIENLRIHDLRRTLGSWQAKMGSSLVVIGKSLNHKSINTTAIYSRVDLDPVRQSVNTAINAIVQASKTVPIHVIASNTIPLVSMSEA